MGELLLVGLEEGDERVARATARAVGWGLRAERGVSGGLGAIAALPPTATLRSLDAAGASLELAERLVAEGRAGALVLVSREATARLAVDAMRAGAREVLVPPLEEEALAALLRSLRSEGGRVPLPDPGAAGELVGSSPELMEVFKTVGRVAPSAATVLITGESGTGKEVVAREIHAASGRARGPFVAVNCAAIPEDLLESELFGHERGAFTGAVARKVGRFERASAGTLFLDEIGDMSLVLQAKILRVLQEREIERLGGEERIRVDVRVVAATHRDLGALIESGDFREDLFYRLAVVRVHLSPLRERGADVRELALHYAATFAASYGRPVRYLGTDALARLEAHDWPGNVRELKNVLERAVLVAGGEVIRGDDVQIDRSRDRVPSGETLPGYSPELSMARVEELHIARVLASVQGHVGRAAEVLGMHRNTVSRKAREFGIPS